MGPNPQCVQTKIQVKSGPPSGRPGKGRQEVPSGPEDERWYIVPRWMPSHFQPKIGPGRSGDGSQAKGQSVHFSSQMCTVIVAAACPTAGAHVGFDNQPGLTLQAAGCCHCWATRPWFASPGFVRKAVEGKGGALLVESGVQAGRLCGQRQAALAVEKAAFTVGLARGSSLVCLLQASWHTLQYNCSGEFKNCCGTICRAEHRAVHRKYMDTLIQTWLHALACMNSSGHDPPFLCQMAILVSGESPPGGGGVGKDAG